MNKSLDFLFVRLTLNVLKQLHNLLLNFVFIGSIFVRYTAGDLPIVCKGVYTNIFFMLVLDMVVVILVYFFLVVDKLLALL